MLERDEDKFEYLRKVKDAKLKGSKREVNPETIERKEARALRSASEIEEMQDHIRGTFGNGITTRALAWAAGNISGGELYDSLESEAKKAGFRYIRPE
jgi:hypothetical protein